MYRHKHMYLCFYMGISPLIVMFCVSVPSLLLVTQVYVTRSLVVILLIVKTTAGMLLTVSLVITTRGRLDTIVVPFSSHLVLGVSIPVVGQYRVTFPPMLTLKSLLPAPPTTDHVLTGSTVVMPTLAGSAGKL